MPTAFGAVTSNCGNFRLHTIDWQTMCIATLYHAQPVCCDLTLWPLISLVACYAASSKLSLKMTLMKDSQEGQLECAPWPIVQEMVVVLPAILTVCLFDSCLGREMSPFFGTPHYDKPCILCNCDSSLLQTKTDKTCACDLTLRPDSWTLVNISFITVQCLIV